jgi:hypothetical protein
MRANIFFCLTTISLVPLVSLVFKSLFSKLFVQRNARDAPFEGDIPRLNIMD